LSKPLRSCLCSLEDAHVRAAAADVAGQSTSDLSIVGPRVAAEQRYQAHDETWCAESALERRVFDESILNWMEIVSIRQTFDSGDRLTGRRIHWSDARVRSPAVEQDRAGSAIPLTASIFASCQAQVMAQDGEKSCLPIHVHFVRFSVYQ